MEAFMDANKRREKIISVLNAAGKPVSASTLAAKCQVSRQIIVGDVALMRASGMDITATPRGYILNSKNEKPCIRIACRHDSAGMKDELYAIVDEGATVLDVMVEHPLYGQLTGSLHLSNRHDVDEFINKSAKAEAQPLSVLTEGIHLHTIEVPDDETLKRVKDNLAKLGILLEG